MRHLVIPITEETVEMLAELNGGIKPQIEGDTLFVYKGSDTPAEIIDKETASQYRWDNCLIMYLYIK